MLSLSGGRTLMNSTTNRRASVVLTIAALSLYLATVKIGASRAEPAPPRAPAAAPAPANGLPISNEIRDFPQLG
jgi:hypothetical protein